MQAPERELNRREVIMRISEKVFEAVGDEDSEIILAPFSTTSPFTCRSAVRSAGRTSPADSPHAERDQRGRGRVGELSSVQLRELIAALARLQPKYPAITDELRGGGDWARTGREIVYGGVYPPVDEGGSV
jgi:hypothetical protein